MKKILSLALALLMFVLPALSCAEEAAPEADADLFAALAAEPEGFLAKYLADGSQLRTDVSLTVGDNILAMLAGENAATVKSLLDVLSFRVKTQSAEDLSQGGLEVLVKGESALSLDVASGPDGLYATASFMNGKIVHLTNEEIQELLKQAIDSMKESGALPAEQADMIAALLNGDVSSFTPELPEIDLTALQNSLMPLMMDVTTEEITEGPELLPDAVSRTVVPLKEESLKPVMEELGKVLYQFLSGLSQIPGLSFGEDFTEEKLISRLTGMVDSLVEDTELVIYSNILGSSLITTEMKLQGSAPAEEGAGEAKIMDLALTVLSTVGETSVLDLKCVAAEQDGKTVTVAVTVTSAEGKTSVVFSADEADGEVSYRPIEVTADITEAEDAASLSSEGKIAFTIISEPEASPVVLRIDVRSAEKDLGGSAAGESELKISEDSLGDILTVTSAQSTEPAEAYIVAEGDFVVDPVKMTEEEQNQFMEEFMTGAQTGLIALMQKLPTEVLMMLMPAPKAPAEAPAEAPAAE